MDCLIVTGSTGMTGIAIIRQAILRGKKVVALVRPNSCNMDRIPDSDVVRVVECALDGMRSLDVTGLRELLTGCSTVFYHLGWGPTDRAGRLDPVRQSKNIGWSLDAVALASRLGCKGFVGAGSQAEYGLHLTPSTAPDTPVNPNTAYGASKYAAGRLCSLAAGQAGLDFAWVRIFSLYGAFESSATMIQSLLPRILANEPCELTEGVQQWDYLNVEDAASAFLEIGESLHGSKTYCLGSGESKTIREYVIEMKDAVGSTSDLLFGAVPYEFGVPNGMRADISSLVADTGWHPRTTFAEGIAQVAASMR